MFRSYHCVSALLLACTPVASMAQERVSSSLIDAIAKCLELKEETERLACSDTAGQALVDATRRREVVIVDKEEVKSTRRSLFGFSLPRLGLFGNDGPDQGEQIDRIEAKVVRVAALGYGKYAIEIEGGARWHTTEGWERPPFPKVGDTLSIRSGSLGGYFVKLGSGSAVRVVKVQ
jgi:hypothetical protein